jgi:hypothetical protein
MHLLHSMSLYPLVFRHANFIPNFVKDGPNGLQAILVARLLSDIAVFLHMIFVILHLIRTLSAKVVYIAAW